MNNQTTTKEQADRIPVIERDGGRMPRLGLGTFQTSGKECRHAVNFALETGYRHIDTARMYKNEEEVGTGIKDSGVAREKIFLTTKLQMGQLDAKGVRDSCERSLSDLGIDYADLLLIHWPEEQVPIEETLGAMEELRTEGKIRHLGVSNFTVNWMKKAVAATDVPIFCNQIEYHPYIPQQPPIRFCSEHGIAVVAYSPLARGRVVKDERLAEIGKKHAKTPAQVGLRWLLEQDDVVAIPKGRSKKHIRENFEIFDFELDDEDLDIIAGLERNQRLIDPDWAPAWDS